MLRFKQELDETPRGEFLQWEATVARGLRNIHPHAPRLILRARRRFLGAGLLVVALWTGTVARALDQEHVAAPSEAVVLYRLFAFLTWLLSLADAVLLHTMPLGLLASAIALAALATSGVVWLIFSACEVLVFSGSWTTWGSTGGFLFVFGALVFPRALLPVVCIFA
ncbi:hypothetical protein Cni_G21907 [Canna indica]|uniref:Uncharacterized protein n=1 Tax=Canna indica TaxID=4628 RepID=A0AAQ3QKQ9_9LILI|nr:hypothetical protein Cni_G21907 [Canna indica]